MVETKQRVISTVVLLLADFAWLGLYMNNQYVTLARTIQGENMKANPVFAVLA